MISAPSSTKNKEGKRDPEMHQAKKGNQWYFRMKVNTRVDKDSDLIHPAAVMAGMYMISRQAPICSTVMRRSTTATLATRGLPKGPR